MGKNSNAGKKAKKAIWNGFNFRISLLFIGVIFGFVCIILRLFYIQIVKGEEYRQAEVKKYKSRYEIKSKRGRIISSDGEILAYDGDDYIIAVDPTLIKDENIDRLMDLLKKNIPSLDTGKIKKLIIEKKSKKEKYLKINHSLGYNERKIIEDELDADPQLGEGVTFDSLFTRNYVRNKAFQEMVGFVNSEKKGVYGIEKTYDESLKEIDGVVEGVRTPRNYLSVTGIKGRKEVPARNGYNIILTVDGVLQYTLDEELRKTFEEYNAVSTMGILMEVETGKILAMSSYPKAETNVTVKNRPITDVFEPGSIFKPVTVAMGLQSKTITPDSTVHSSGAIRIGDRIIRDHNDLTRGDVTLENLIAYSGNVGMVKIAQTLDNNTFYNYLTSVGLGTKTGLDTYAEMSPKIIDLKNLTAVRKANISFGQGVAMTQIQMMMALNTVINDGKLMKPYLVDRIEDDQGNVVHENTPKVIKRVFDSKVSEYNRKYMEAVITKGTGKEAYIQGYRIGGKSGTAQKSGNRGYEAGKYFSSFFAFFPVDNPKYAILITINEPRGGKYYGAAVALPSVRNVLQKLIKYKGINPQGNIDEKIKEKIVEDKEQKDLKKLLNQFNKSLMPDLTGLSLREIISIYPQSKFPKYKITGSGSVAEQYPTAGTKLTKDSEVRIILK